MLGRFYATQEGLDFLEECIADALGPSLDDEKRSMLHTVVNYLRTVQLHVPFRQTMAERRIWRTRYDVQSWRSDGYVRDLSEYALPHEQVYATVVEPAKQAVIESRIATFGEHPTGLGKFTRTMFAQDLRRSLQPVGADVRERAGVAV
jgi:hypothetical protein